MATAGVKAPAKRAPRSKSEPPKPLISAAQLAAILRAIRIGMEPTRAALTVGISKETFEKALKLDPIMQAKVDQALAVCELNALDKINRGLEGWQAFRWLLERKYPERYGFKQFVVRPDQTDDGADAEVIPETRMERLRREREERANAASRGA